MCVILHVLQCFCITSVYVAVHRLDRLTSGLLIFAKSVGSARRFEKQIKARLVSKEYLCRVQGEFPTYV